MSVFHSATVQLINQLKESLAETKKEQWKKIRKKSPIATPNPGNYVAANNSLAAEETAMNDT